MDWLSSPYSSEPDEQTQSLTIHWKTFLCKFSLEQRRRSEGLFPWRLRESSWEWDVSI